MLLGLTAATLVFGTMFITTDARAAQSACPAPTEEPRINMKTDRGRIAHHKGHTRNQLTAMQRQRRGAATATAPGWKPVGLTITDLNFSLKVQVNAVSRGRGPVCASLVRADAFLGYERLDVYVARRYRPGSCEHRAILDHENKHVAIFRRTLEAYAPRVERRLHREAAALGAITAATPEAAANAVHARLKSRIQPLFDQMNREMDAANARLDTPAAYRLEQKRCGLW